MFLGGYEGLMFWLIYHLAYLPRHTRASQAIVKLKQQLPLGHAHVLKKIRENNFQIEYQATVCPGEALFFFNTWSVLSGSKVTTPSTR